MLYFFDNKIFDHQLRFDGRVKPIWAFQTDGGPDENLCFRDVQRMYLTMFLKYRPDVLLVCRPAAGFSPYNPCERRMAPLSRALSGVFIPADMEGSHLDSEGV